MIDNDAPDPLTRLAIRHGCDKWGTHFYTPVYHGLFGHLRDQPLRLLEIGIGGFEFPTVGGASLRMWADYFPHARIVGIDIVEKRLQIDPRVTTLLGSQDDEDFLASVVAAHGPFDIIIDDGSHVPAHVLASFNALFPALADGGLYVIEDVQTCFWPGRGGSPDTGAETMLLARGVLECLHHAEILLAQPERMFPAFASQIRSFRAFHNIFAIEKGDNTEPSSHGYRADNPHARSAITLMRAELARAPTPDGYANLLDTLTQARDWALAGAVRDAALRDWPGHPRLVLAAAMMAHELRDVAQLAALRGVALSDSGSAAEVAALLASLEAEARQVAGTAEADGDVSPAG